MDITISSRKLELSEPLVAVIRRKLSRLGRLHTQMTRAEVHLFEEQNPRIIEREICEIVMEGHGQHIRCKVSARDGYAAVDKAVTKLEQQLAKVKTKTTTRQYARV